VLSSLDIPSEHQRRNRIGHKQTSRFLRLKQLSVSSLDEVLLHVLADARGNSARQDVRHYRFPHPDDPPTLIFHRLPGTKILLHTARNNDMLAANASRYGVFRVVDKTDGRNLLAIIREIDPNSEGKS